MNKKKENKQKTITIKKDEGVKRGRAYKSGRGLDTDI